MTKLGMDPKTRVTAMVELFDRYSAGAWLYRMLSSHAHGKQWGVLTSTRVEIEPLAAFPDLTSARVSADDKVTVVAAFHAIRGLRMALEERMHYLGYALSTELPG